MEPSFSDGKAQNRKQEALAQFASGYDDVENWAGSNVRSFTYYPSGQVSQDVRDPSDSYTFAANDNGRNASASLNGSTVGSYLYNAFEQRVQKSVGAVTTQFIYDTAGHLLEETNGATGAALREYIWLDDLPVAMVDDTGTSPILYYIHTDQLGTPQKITDGNANVVWEGLFDPFGNPISISGGLWGTGIWGSFNWAQSTTGFVNNLRFPGQYADAETALNQNWNRDYDPSTGRYIQSDPIGLEGGINTYGYVLQNPIRLIDPDGTGITGAIIGGIIGGLGTSETGPGAIAGAIEGAELGSALEDFIEATQQTAANVLRRSSCPPNDCEKE